MQHEASIWSNPAAIAEFRSMAASSLSYGEIARDMSRKYGPISRAACIGKAARMGIKKPRAMLDPTVEHKPRPKRKVAGFSFRKPLGERTEPVLIDLPADESPHAIGIMDLGQDHCRWPLGEPRRDMLYCGDLAFDGMPYCGRHHCIAYYRRGSAA